ncbi:3 -5 exoribonuclease 1 [Brachionus plicatilis]|uniref:3-5 exoribonuclease 1 n=1 Tax=Brachionus plicatilis TaxID=10195 RepID=A0A3M7SEB3_BRAPC|nr:3 -5 exoribonuclease 1 [Brachionus plicatilis]
MESENTTSKNKNDYDPTWLKGTSAEELIKSESSTKKNFSHPVFKKLSKINGKINDMSLDDLVESLDKLKLDSSGKKEVLVKRLKSYYKESNVEAEKCKYDFIGVIDFEATCTEVQNKNYPHEIIEFPIVLIDMKSFSIVDHFSSYCKPIINPRLSSFCTQLTGITQDKVDEAEDFKTVLKKADEWIESHELGKKFKFAIATDGPWDMQNFLNLQCSHSGIQYPRWAKKWIDVRKLFSNWLGVRRCNIAKMLAYYDLEFEGSQHCGLDDAQNIARVLIHLAKDGCEIKINDHLKKCLTQVGNKNNEPNELEPGQSV